MMIPAPPRACTRCCGIAAPRLNIEQVTAIGLRRLRGLGARYERGAHQRRLAHSLATSGGFHGAGYGVEGGTRRNYYARVLVAAASSADRLAVSFAEAGLPPDSIRYGYRPLYHQPIFAKYASPCPNAEALAATTLQVPVHPGMSPAALEWVSDRVCAFAQEPRA